MSEMMIIYEAISEPVLMSLTAESPLACSLLGSLHQNSCGGWQPEWVNVA